MTSAEFWGEMLRETRGDPDRRKFDDLTEWLHCYGSEDHEVIKSDLQEDENTYCYHVFRDSSILDCRTGETVTFEDAAKKIGNPEVTNRPAMECLGVFKVRMRGSAPKLAAELIEMPRPRIYASNAERQATYRARRHRDGIVLRKVGRGQARTGARSGTVGWSSLRHYADESAVLCCERNPEGGTASDKSPLTPSSVVLTVRKPRRVRQPTSGWRKGGPAPTLPPINPKTGFSSFDPQRSGSERAVL
jgi:hypothetical protein